MKQMNEDENCQVISITVNISSLKLTSGENNSSWINDFPVSNLVKIIFYGPDQREILIDDLQSWYKSRILPTRCVWTMHH